jgi:hypothetical protein
MLRNENSIACCTGQRSRGARMCLGLVGPLGAEAAKNMWGGRRVQAAKYLVDGQAFGIKRSRTGFLIVHIDNQPGRIRGRRNRRHPALQKTSSCPCAVFYPPYADRCLGLTEPAIEANLLPLTKHSSPPASHSCLKMSQNPASSAPISPPIPRLFFPLALRCRVAMGQFSPSYNRLIQTQTVYVALSNAF